MLVDSEKFHAKYLTYSPESKLHDHKIMRFARDLSLFTDSL